LVPAEESDIKLATLEVVGQLCRVVARNPDSILGNSSRRTLVAGGSQTLSTPIWKPMAKVGLAGCAARRAASAAAAA
jgi:hypothetical protein